jgi:hypothetical protein
MTSLGSDKNRGKKSVRHFEKGKIYFSKTAEQRFFFTLTVIMLLAGILYKFGLLH